MATFILTLVLLGLVWGTIAAVRGSRRRLALERLGPSAAEMPRAVAVDDSEEPLGTGLTRWLGLAGYRSPTAAAAFPFLCLVSGAAGLALVALLAVVGAFAALKTGLQSIPGEFGAALTPLVDFAPWMLVLLFAALPALVVRSARRTRIAGIERDLPVFLELLSTLASAGLGFDASITSVLDSDRGDGPLADEFRTFQRETLAGVARVRCLRRLARRIDIPAFSTFISSLVQAERSGFGLSDVLRIQADDVRNRRKENALMKAQALPVKLVFPLVVCFLPALFVLTLGPAFFSFLRVADTVLGRVK